MFAVGFSYTDFIINIKVSSYSYFVECFFMKGCWILSRFYLHDLRWSCGFSYHFVDVARNIDFPVLNFAFQEYIPLGRGV